MITLQDIFCKIKLHDWDAGEKIPQSTDPYHAALLDLLGYQSYYKYKCKHCGEETLCSRGGF